ncbi:enoyl-CoA hydratase [Variovorax sp. dw_308]|uniref:enoyl-CoA hydratase n=1 Tax=Variovorax sp. dw_308 TaxID=2721546 RepID=UPI001C47C1BF|nr:enoyl-CoA hydratase [Variovorax sp. dw_308]
MTNDASGLVTVERPFAGCAVVTLNRPRAMNALSVALRRELVSTFEALRSDADARVIVLTGAGNAFCAGLDLKELGAAAEPGAAVAPAADEDPMLAMLRLQAPVIGAINGPAITGGFELALACDLMIASTRASFADTHARVGVMPGWGLSQRLPRLIGPGRAKELSLTGNFLDARQAEAWGLVNRVVEPDALLPAALKLASDMLSVLPEMLVAYKRLIDDGLRTGLAEGLELERERSRAWAAGLRGADIEARRRQIAERGRAQGKPAS